jgi:hypothetical protein
MGEPGRLEASPRAVVTTAQNQITVKDQTIVQSRPVPCASRRAGQATDGSTNRHRSARTPLTARKGPTADSGPARKARPQARPDTKDPARKARHGRARPHAQARHERPGTKDPTARSGPTRKARRLGPRHERPAHGRRPKRKGRLTARPQPKRPARRPAVHDHPNARSRTGRAVHGRPPPRHLACRGQ